MKQIQLIILICLAIPTYIEAAEETPPRLGRLFLSPNDRAALDVIRQNNKAPDKVITAEETIPDEELESELPPPSSPVTLKGYIRRSDGKNTIWVNNQVMSEKSASKELTVGNLQKNSGQVQITLNGAEKKTIALKPGQIYDPNSGQVYNHAKDVPLPIGEEAEETSTVLDNIAEQVGLNNIKDKARALIDLLKPAENSKP